jgi:hypothetical protein
MKQAVIIICTDKFHRGNDVPLMKREEETKKYREQYKYQNKKQVRRHQEVRQQFLFMEPARFLYLYG